LRPPDAGSPRASDAMRLRTPNAGSPRASDALRLRTPNAGSPRASDALRLRTPNAGSPRASDALRLRTPIDGAGLAALVTTERVMITERDEVDMVTRGRAYTDSLAGRRVTVVGLARSGVAAARLLRAAGAQVTGTDLKPLEALGCEATALEALGVRLVTGQATRGAFDGADLVAGNIGTPLAAHALGFPPDGLVVCEASSFQLESTEAFQPRVAAVLNIAPDHLDRHGSLAAYVDAKARIFANQTPADCAVLNADDEATAALARRTRAHVVWFSRRRSLSHGVFVRDGRIAAQLDGHVEEICPVAEIFLRGAHN